MRPDLDPALCTPDERRRDVAAILAAGLRRLRDRAALALENPAAPSEMPLEPVAKNPLSVHVG